MVLLDRWRARRRIRRRVSLWYHRDYAAPELTATTRFPGLDPERGEHVISALAEAGLVRNGDVWVPAPARISELARVHSEAWLERATTADALAHVFGLPEEMVHVDALLSAARRAVGGTIAAAREVAAGRVPVAVNLGGGFHHAEPDQGSGFCVYNDIAVAIAALRANGDRRRVAIVDLDYHEGNGNRAAFAKDPSVFTASLHGSVWSHGEALADLGIVLPSGTGDDAYLQGVERLLAAVEAHQPALVFYVAGNDVLAGDALGDFELSWDGLLTRDIRVVQMARGQDAGLVVTLGGGYQDEIWRGSHQLVRWLLTDKRTPDRPARPDTTRFRQIAHQLDPFELQRDEDNGSPWITAEDIVGGLTAPAGGHRFLDYYSLHGIEYALEAYGLMDLIRDRGYRDLRLTWDLTDRWRQLLRVHGRHETEDAWRVLVELAVRTERREPPEGADWDGPIQVLWIEWLLLQDPAARFSLARPRLPGQKHPGLGIAEEILQLLLRLSERLGLEAVLHNPAHYHNAAAVMGLARFWDPAAQGRMEALTAALGGLSLPEASIAVDQRRVRTADGEIVEWQPAQLCFPVTARVRDWLEGEDHRATAAKARAEWAARGLALHSHES